MMEWQPIETAPKDGTEIIGVFYRQWEEKEKPTVYGPWTLIFQGNKWWASNDGCKIIEYMDWGGTDYMEVEIDPTHWMPLPEPPKP